MIENGFAHRRIANKLKMNIKDVQHIGAKNGFQLKKELFNDDMIGHIMQLYNDGISAKALGIKYSIDKRRVQRWAKEGGFLRTRNESHRFTFFNENYFDEINTPDKAYWLGFFYADAYNCQSTNTISIALAAKDHGHVVKLASAVDLPLNKVIKGYSELNEIKYPTSNLKLYSKHMCTTLAKFGCPQAKSFIIKYPKWLNSDLDSHFIRGMFDGDGCLTLRNINKEWKWSLVSTKECCESINAILLNNLNISTSLGYISKTNNNTYILTTGGNEKIHKIMKWLYDDSIEDIRLSRKFSKYEGLIQQQNNRRFSRNSYRVSASDKDKILLQIHMGIKITEIADQFKLHPRTILKIKGQIK